MCDNCLCKCASLIIGFLLFIGGSVAVIYFGFHVANPFLDTMHFREAKCTVAEVRDLGSLTCKCGHECQSVFPCKTVSVKLNTEGGTSNATLFRDGDTWLNYKDKKCSSSTCRRKIARNSEAVKDFLAEYGQIGKEYPCFFNPDNEREAIQEKIGWLSLGLHMGIPTVCALIGLVLIIATCKGC